MVQSLLHGPPSGKSMTDHCMSLWCTLATQTTVNVRQFHGVLLDVVLSDGYLSQSHFLPFAKLQVCPYYSSRSLSLLGLCSFLLLNFPVSDFQADGFYWPVLKLNNSFFGHL